MNPGNPKELFSNYHKIGQGYMTAFFSSFAAVVESRCCHVLLAFNALATYLSSASGTVYTASRAGDNSIVAIKQMNLAQQPKKVAVLSLPVPLTLRN